LTRLGTESTYFGGDLTPPVLCTASKFGYVEHIALSGLKIKFPLPAEEVTRQTLLAWAQLRTT
jgi:hypothetical protein